MLVSMARRMIKQNEVSIKQTEEIHKWTRKDQQSKIAAKLEARKAQRYKGGRREGRDWLLGEKFGYLFGKFIVVSCWKIIFSAYSIYDDIHV